MPSHYETFFDHDTFAVVGHRAERPFPTITYSSLKKRGKKVFAVDPSADDIDGDPAYADLFALPEKADAVILELPKQETAQWVEKAAAAGFTHVWLHMNTDTPEALEIARQHGLDVRYGTCAVQYVNSGFPHGIHKLIRKVMGRY